MVMGDREKRAAFEVPRELSRLSDLKGVSLQCCLRVARLRLFHSKPVMNETAALLNHIQPR